MYSSLESINFPGGTKSFGSGHLYSISTNASSKGVLRPCIGSFFNPMPSKSNFFGGATGCSGMDGINSLPLLRSGISKEGPVTGLAAVLVTVSGTVSTFVVSDWFLVDFCSVRLLRLTNHF